MTRELAFLVRLRMVVRARAVCRFINVGNSKVDTLTLVLRKGNCEIRNSSIRACFFARGNLSSTDVAVVPFGRTGVAPNLAIVTKGTFPSSRRRVTGTGRLNLAIVHCRSFVNRLVGGCADITVANSRKGADAANLLSRILSKVTPADCLVNSNANFNQRSTRCFILRTYRCEHRFLTCSPSCTVVAGVSFSRPSCCRSVGSICDTFTTFTSRIGGNVVTYKRSTCIHRLGNGCPMAFCKFTRSGSIITGGIAGGAGNDRFSIRVGNRLFNRFRVPSFNARGVLGSLTVLAFY